MPPLFVDEDFFGCLKVTVWLSRAEVPLVAVSFMLSV
jgi:hypothetical protein